MSENTKWKFYVLELSIYIPAAFFSFIGNYFNSIHLSDLQNGILGGLFAFVLLISNPLWMRVSDHRTKNYVLFFLALGSSILIWLVFYFRDFLLLFISVFLLAFLWTSVIPVAESISLMYSRKGDFSFGTARMMGSLSYAVAMGIFGYIKSEFLFFLIGSLSFLAIAFNSFLVPKTTGYNLGRKTHHSFKGLPKEFYKMLVLEFIVFPSSSFGAYFLPILMKDRGDPLFFAGLAMGLPALFELPFLIFADRIMKFLGVKGVLTLASITFGVRWILTWAFKNAIIVTAIQGLEIFNWIAIYYAILYYINMEIKSSRRSDAQTLFWMVTSGFSSILGMAFGGLLATFLGVENSYLFFGIVSIAGGVMYGVWSEDPSHHVS